MKHLLLLALLSLTFNFTYAQDETEEPLEITEEQLNFLVDSINGSFTYQYGHVELANNIAGLDVPEGFKFLDAEQSQYVLTDLWGNPPSPSLGMLFPENSHPIRDLTYAVDISFEEEGYIEDDDAADIDYDDMEDQLRKDIAAENPSRAAQGYEQIEFIGWASDPFYDHDNKKLHWAKEIAFEGSEINTLNYEIRILGRKGFLDMNVIGDIDVLPKLKQDIDVVLGSVNFKEGNRYEDFDSSMDRVAAYGIGGLVAGKILAKVGFFAVIAKFGKFIVIGLVGLFAAFKNRLFGKKEKEVVQEIEN